MRRICSSRAVLLGASLVFCSVSGFAFADCEKSEHIYQSVIDNNPYIGELWGEDASVAERTILELKLMALGDKKSKVNEPDSQSPDLISPEEQKLIGENPLLQRAYEHNPEELLELLKRVREVSE